MGNPVLAKWCAVVAAILFACVVTITFINLPGRLLAYVSCATFAITPFFPAYAFETLTASASLMVVAVIVARRGEQ